MKFLIKAAFWLGIVVFFLPAPQGDAGANTQRVSTVDAIAFLSTAYSDVKGFCIRNPDACVTGAAAMQNWGVKAEYGSKILHDFISQKVADAKDLPVPKGSGLKPIVNQQKQAFGNHGTLNDADLAPAFHAPKMADAQN